MAERISQSITKRVSFEAFLSSDHISPATGKTIAVTISKNGGAFGNPSGGATNATEISNGSYYVDLSTTDTGTLGPLIIRGSEGTIDQVKVHFSVESPLLSDATQITEPSGPPSLPLTVLTALAHTAFFSGVPINKRVQYDDHQDLYNQADSVIAKKEIALVSSVSIEHGKIEAP